MRTLSDLERCNQTMVVTEAHEFFIRNNTSTHPSFEKANGEWISVYPIRYGGIANGPNRFKL